MLQLIIDQWEDDTNDTLEETLTDLHRLPESLNFDEIKFRGSHQGGTDNVACYNKILEITDFLKEERLNESNDIALETDQSNVDDLNNCVPTKNEIIRLLLQRIQIRKRSFEDITGLNEEVEILTANGSVCSIISWAKGANLDKGQRRAFEVLCSHFVLSFYDDADSLPGKNTSSNRARFALKGRD